jgi:hypothetical protein
MLDGSNLEGATSQLRASFNLPVRNTIPLRNDVAAAVLSRGKYPFA